MKVEKSWSYLKVVLGIMEDLASFIKPEPYRSQMFKLLFKIFIFNSYIDEVLIAPCLRHALPPGVEDRG